MTRVDLEAADRPMAQRDARDESRRAARALTAVGHPVSWIVAGILALVAVVVVGLLLTAHPAWSRAEFALDRMLDVHSFALVDVTALVFDMMVSTVAALVLLAIAGLMIYLLADSVTAAVFLGFVGASWAASVGLAHLVDRPLLDLDAAHPLAGSGPLSFPSTPTVFGAAVIIGFVVVARRGPWRWGVAGVAAAALALLIWSRLRLAVGYPSDAVAGVVVALAIAAIYYPLALNVVLPAIRSRMRRRGRGSV
ncbi:phosphatase PAP2 family protein [Rathayibacter sp. CAU 1779]